MPLGLAGRRPRRGDPQYAVYEFVRDTDGSRFSRTGWPILTMLIAVGAAWVAAHRGVPAGLAIVAAVTAVLVAAAFTLERERWRAQDVLHRYQAARIAQWVADTGSVGPPRFDVAANEVWLGAHQPGTVPQVYRAHAAAAVHDERVLERELAEMPDATPVERVNSLWVLAGSWDQAARSDLTELRAAVKALPPGDDRALFEAYLGHVEALRRHREGSAQWLAPMAAARAAFPSVRLGAREQFRIVVSRFWPAAWFAVFGTIAVVALSPLWGPTIPAAYAKTELSTRGELPPNPSDPNALWLALPGVADALPTARRSGEELQPDEWAQLIDRGVPTVIWDVHGISLTPPADQPGRHVVQVEVLLASSSVKDGWVIVTFDTPAGPSDTLSGPSYLYDLSPSAVRAVQDAVGVAPAGS